MSVEPINYCNVQAPEGYIPENDEQNIEIMRPLFNEFERLYHAFSKDNPEQAIAAGSHRDFMQTAFYQYHKSEHWLKHESPDWQTLARWRYQNEEMYRLFRFWHFSCNGELS